jgi:hypothetical protein
MGGRQAFKQVMNATMKKILFPAALALSLLCANLNFGSSLQASGVAIPNSANWALHFDGRAFAQTQLGEAVASRPKSEKEQAHMALSVAMLGFDFERDLHAVTVYGPDQKRENAVMLVQGNFEPTKVWDYLVQRSSFEETGHRGHLIWQWEREGGEVLFAVPGAIAFHGSGQAVLAGSPERAAEALDFLDGQVSAAAIPLPPEADAPYFMAFGNLKALGNLRPEAALLRQSNGFMVAVGEQDELVSTQVTLDADSSEAARQIEAVIQGIQAYALLRSTGDWAGIPDWLLTGTIVRDDSTLHFFLEAPIERVLKLLERRLGNR